MRRALFLLWFSLELSTGALATTFADSTAKKLFPKLTEQIGLKDPVLSEGEYEVRIWNQQGLHFGQAQMVYILRKSEKKFTLAKYNINSNEQGFQSAIRLKPTVTVTPNFWERLLKQNILTLPNESVVFERLYPKPKPGTDTTRIRIEADGSFTVIKNRILKRKTMVSDGEGFLFELFSANSYRVYSYGNPDVYLKDEPQCKELQSVLGILNDLSLMFRSDEAGRDQAKVLNND